MALLGKFSLFKGSDRNEGWRPALSLDQGAIGGACCAMNRHGLGQVIWENHGRLWTQTLGASPGAAPFCSPLGSGRDPRMAVNLEGVGVVAWIQDGPEGCSLVGLPMATGKAPGVTACLFSTAGTIHHLQLGADRRGGALLVWTHELDGEYEVLGLHFDPRARAWGAIPVRLGGKRREPVEPRLAMNRRGQAVVVWREPAEGLMAAYHFPSMGAWSDQPVLVASGPVQTYQAALDHAGSLMLLLVQQGNGQRARLEARVHSAGSSSWLPAETLATAQQFSQVRLALSGSGEAEAVWLQNEGSTASFLHARAFRAGAWEARATRLEAEAGRVGEFALAMGPRGLAAILCIVRHQGAHLPVVHDKAQGWRAPGAVGLRIGEAMATPLISLCAQGAIALWRAGEGDQARLRMSQRFGPQRA